MAIEVTFFRFATINVKPDEMCRTDIEGGRLRLRSTLQGQGAQEADADPGDDPDAAGALRRQGWWPRLSRRDSARAPNGRALPQPAAMGKAGVFSALALDFTTTAFCRCEDIEGLCKKTRFRLAVAYDGATHPTVEAFVGEERDCTAADADPTTALKATTSDSDIPAGDDNVEPAEAEWLADLMGHLPPSEQAKHRQRLEAEVERAHTDRLGRKKRFVFFRFAQTCPCTSPHPEAARELDFFEALGLGLLASRPCDILIEVEYNYRQT